MTSDFNLWKEQVRQSLVQLSCLQKPRRYAPASAAALVLAFRGLLTHLYRDAFFTEFVVSCAWQQAGLSEHTGRALDALRLQLDEFDEPDSDAELVADPSWGLLQQQAAAVARLLA